MNLHSELCSAEPRGRSSGAPPHIPLIISSVKTILIIFMNSFIFLVTGLIFNVDHQSQNFSIINMHKYIIYGNKIFALRSFISISAPKNCTFTLQVFHEKLDLVARRLKTSDSETRKTMELPSAVLQSTQLNRQLRTSHYLTPAYYDRMNSSRLTIAEQLPAITDLRVSDDHWKADRIWGSSQVITQLKTSQIHMPMQK